MAILLVVSCARESPPMGTPTPTMSPTATQAVSQSPDAIDESFPDLDGDLTDDSEISDLEDMANIDI